MLNPETIQLAGLALSVVVCGLGIIDWSRGFPMLGAILRKVG